MKKKIIIIILLVIIESILIVIYSKMGSSNTSNTSFSFDKSSIKEKNSNSNTNSDTKEVSITSTAQVSSGLTEKLELHATYYFEEIYVEENQLVKKGTKILKYTNGNYLKAPYDLIVTGTNVPDKSKQVTNNHYIEVISNNVLKVEIKVDESSINNIKIGDSAKVKIQALDKEYEGVITNISNTANKGKFSVTIEFENDGNIKIGMSATITIKG